MMTRTLIALALLAWLSACATQQQPYLAGKPDTRAWLLAQNKLFRVSEKVRVAAAPLCTRTVGTVGDMWQIPARYTDRAFAAEATKILGLREGERVVISVAAGLPADRAGIRLGDTIVGAVGEVVTVKRDGETFEVKVPPVPACDVKFTLVSSWAANASASSEKATVAVTFAMVQATFDDDELAFVLAHELSHIIHGDSNLAASTTVKVATILLGGIGQVAAQAAVTPAVRDREAAADELGCRIMAVAGYDPREAPRILQRFSQDGGWLSDHPGTDDRMRALATVADDIDRRKVANLPLLP